MHAFRSAAFVAAAFLAIAIAQPQGPTRVRGTITAFDGTTLSVKSREGQDLKIELARGNVHVEVLQVVLARAADANGLAGCFPDVGGRRQGTAGQIVHGWINTPRLGNCG